MLSPEIEAAILAVESSKTESEAVSNYKALQALAEDTHSIGGRWRITIDGGFLGVKLCVRPKESP